MTVQDLIVAAGEYWAVLLGLFIAIPVCAWLLGLSHGKGNGTSTPWRYFYTVLVYLACIPGILAAVLTAYSLFIIRQNLLETNLLVYFLPIISMVVTLAVIRANVELDGIPGFGRLTGLMTLIAITFVLILAIEKTRIWLVFAGSIARLIGLVIGVFALLKWGAYMLFRRADEPQVKPPAFPT